MLQLKNYQVHIENEQIDEQAIQINESFLSIAGKRFHHVWLRDHCLCSQCYRTGAFQKLFDISDHPNPPHPKSVKIQNDHVVIDWQENPPHRSVFSLSRLLNHVYDNGVGERVHQSVLESQLTQKKVLWDSETIKANTQHRIQFKSSTLNSIIDQIDSLGFALLRNLPWEILGDFLATIGPIYQLGRNGDYSTVKATQNPQDLSYEGWALAPHTDLTYMPAPRVVQILYCVENQSSGGESVLVDGYRVVQDFRIQHPEYFRVLSEKSVQFREFSVGWGYFLSHSTPILKLDQSGDISDIFFCHKNFDLELPFDDVKTFYDAYRTFAQYLKNPIYQYWFRLEPGDCLMVQNFRILHGRGMFDPSSGNRHLEVAYMEWIYYFGLRNFHKVKPLYDAP